MSQNEFVKTLKEKILISQVVGEFVRLKKSGNNYSGLCPFHGEKTPSFSVSDSKGMFHCFGCQKGGDVITFIQEIQSVSFPEAIQILAKKFDIALPKEYNGKSATQKQDQNEIYYRLNHFVASFYYENFFSNAGEKAREYFLSRGLTLETAKKYLIGFAPDDWSALYDKMEKSKVPMDVAEKLGLIRKKSNADKIDSKQRQYFDFFRNRLMIPVLDSRGRVFAFGARTLGEEGPKYLNSSDSPIFKKGNQVYGLFQAQRDIRAEDACIIVEGYMDCLALHQAGIGNVVATLGTALTPVQIEMLKRFTNNFIVIFDGDAAGIAAQSKSMETFLNAGIIVKGVSLPEKMDPDEFVQKVGKDQFLDLIHKSPYILDEKILELAGASHSLEAKSKAIETVLNWIQKIPSDAARFLRLQQIATLFNVPISQLKSKVGIKQQSLTKSNQFTSKAQPKSMKFKDKYENLDIKFLELCVENPNELFLLGVQEEVIAGFSSEKNVEIYRNLVSSLQETFTKTGKKYFNSEILELFSDPKIKSIFARTLVTLDSKVDTQTSSSALEFQDIIARMIRRSKEKRREQLRALILQAENSGRSSELTKLMIEYKDLVKTLER